MRSLLLPFAFLFAAVLTTRGEDLFPSPNHKYSYRPPGENDLPIAVVETAKTRVVAKLPDDAVNTFIEEAKVIWSPDSQRFAFNYHAGTRYETSILYQLRKDKFVELRSPESAAVSSLLERMKDAELKKMGAPKDIYRRRIWDAFTIDRWIDADTAEMIAHSDITVPFGKDSDSTDVSVWLKVTLKFDKDGTWKIAKSHAMSEDEIQKAQK